MSDQDAGLLFVTRSKSLSSAHFLILELVGPCTQFAPTMMNLLVLALTVIPTATGLLRNLQDVNPSCQVADLLEESCTMQQFCTDLVELAPTFANVYCEGNITFSFFVRLRYQELCFANMEEYAQHNGDFLRGTGSPYDADTFDATTHFCVKQEQYQNFTSGVLQSQELRTLVTRPETKAGMHVEAHSMELCGAGQTSDELFGDDFCSTGCPAVSIDGDACSCCGEQADCSVLHSGLVDMGLGNIMSYRDGGLVESDPIVCEEPPVASPVSAPTSMEPPVEDAGDMEAPVDAPVEAPSEPLASPIIERSCDMQEMLEGTCNLGEFCSEIMALVPPFERVNCKGDTDSNFVVSVQSSRETCYKQTTDYYAGRGYPFDEALFDEETDFCIHEMKFQNYTEGILIHQEYRIIVTRPAHKAGSVVTTHAMESCGEGSSSDELFGNTYCERPCPEVLLVDDGVCKSECGCDGGRGYDCSNLHPALVQGCNGGRNFLEKVLLYRTGLLTEEDDEEKNPGNEGGGDTGSSGGDVGEGGSGGDTGSSGADSGEKGSDDTSDENSGEGESTEGGSDMEDSSSNGNKTQTDSLEDTNDTNTTTAGESDGEVDRDSGITPTSVLIGVLISYLML